MKVAITSSWSMGLKSSVLVVIKHSYMLPLQRSVEERIMEMVQQRKQGGCARDPSSSRGDPYAYMDWASGSARNQVSSRLAGLAFLLAVCLPSSDEEKKRIHLSA